MSLHPDNDPFCQVVHSFGSSGITAEARVRGWSQPEDQHAWNDGPEAELELTVPFSDCMIALTLECLPFIGGRCQHQDVTLYVNGLRIKFWRLKLAEIHRLEAMIDLRQIPSMAAGGRLICLWHLPCSTSPQEAGTGNDSRALGLCFRNLTISADRTHTEALGEASSVA